MKHNITKETARKIWSHYNEIDKAEQLLSEIEKKVHKQHDNGFGLDNIFGKGQFCKFSIPSGEMSHDLYGVNPLLSIKIVTLHIEEHKKALKEMHCYEGDVLNTIESDTLENVRLLIDGLEHTQYEYTDFVKGQIDYCRSLDDNDSYNCEEIKQYIIGQFKKSIVLVFDEMKKC